MLINPCGPNREIIWLTSWPISGSFAAAVAICWSSAIVVTGRFILSSAAWTAAAPLTKPRRNTMGLAPAVMSFSPSRMSSWANTTVVVEPSPALSLVAVAACFKS